MKITLVLSHIRMQIETVTLKQVSKLEGFLENPRSVWKEIFSTLASFMAVMLVDIIVLVMDEIAYVFYSHIRSKTFLNFSSFHSFSYSTLDTSHT